MSGTSRGPSMHDVAALAGVSHQTVSRVINGSANLRPATRERVLAAIEELGYRRNMAARALVTGRTHSIGVLTPGEPNFGKMSSVQAVEHAMREAGYFPLVTSSASESASIAEALEFLNNRSIEALVVVAPHDMVLTQLEGMKADLPVITLQTGGYDAGHAVAIDQAHGVRVAIDYLRSMGHTRIQHVSGPSDYFEAQLRRAAFDEAVAAHGLAEFETLEGDWRADSGYACGTLVAPDATAVFCSNDQMALGLIHALSDAGRSVPGDVSVVGFDDIPESAHSLPPLTTIHQDFEGVGHRAVELILAQLDDEPAPQGGPLTPWLVERQSVARI
ncbi:LacI family DNA-binding transcriptional regulator [Demequina oxidasica]|uniref:LacI family DNA-binding transcriptional regulator n=1 Tax=Demequina oxidasica TaxID=676199 RepID=UPI000A02E255|nr:LacI family DNA-binding transcriptional regulator [Demequina oxidasica]